MKNKTLLIMAFALFFTSCNNDNEVKQRDCEFVSFKYYNGKPDNLGELQNNYILVGIDTIYNDTQIKNFISTIKQFDQNYAYTIFRKYKYKEIPLRLKTSKTCEQITQLISELEQNTIVSYVHFTMKTDDCQNLIWEQIGNLCINSYKCDFYVKVFDKNDLTDLNRIIKETKTELIGQIKFMPNVFELRATKESNGDALKMANYFHETGLFEYSEPSISKYPVE